MTAAALSAMALFEDLPRVHDALAERADGHQLLPQDAVLGVEHEGVELLALLADQALAHGAEELLAALDERAGGQHLLRHSGARCPWRP